LGRSASGQGASNDIKCSVTLRFSILLLFFNSLIVWFLRSCQGTSCQQFLECAARRQREQARCRTLRVTLPHFPRPQATIQYLLLLIKTLCSRVRKKTSTRRSHRRRRTCCRMQQRRCGAAHRPYHRQLLVLVSVLVSCTTAFRTNHWFPSLMAVSNSVEGVRRVEKTCKPRLMCACDSFPEAWAQIINPKNPVFILKVTKSCSEITTAGGGGQGGGKLKGQRRQLREAAAG
jgi:hypothetical protein